MYVRLDNNWVTAGNRDGPCMCAPSPCHAKSLRIIWRERIGLVNSKVRSHHNKYVVGPLCIYTARVLFFCANTVGMWTYTCLLRVMCVCFASVPTPSYRWSTCIAGVPPFHTPASGYRPFSLLCFLYSISFVWYIILLPDTVYTNGLPTDSDRDMAVRLRRASASGPIVMVHVRSHPSPTGENS